jgi:uncharacterized protein with FMN-binding domain
MEHITGLTILLLTAASLTIAAVLPAGCAGIKPKPETPPAPEPADSVYEGSAAGYRGMIRVQVRMEAGAITEIIILDSAEDQNVGGAAMEELAEYITMYNTTSIDTISGATESSKGFLSAVENAILSP